MQEGTRLLEQADTNAEPALALFDRALELRSRLPTEIPVHAFNLAACWLSRADALARIQGLDWTTQALAAYDEALALLRPLPLADDARYSRRLAITYQNRALVLAAQNPPAMGEAADALATAAQVLEEAGPFDDRLQLVAVVWMNLANVRAMEGTPESDVAARDAAERAIAHVTAYEREHIGAAQVGLSARAVICQTIARRLPAIAPGETSDDVHEATDVVEDGLTIVRHWERQGPSPFRGIAADLFRFGARVYIHFQPHFLSEFVRENLDPEESSQDFVESAEIQDVAHEIARYTTS